MAWITSLTLIFRRLPVNATPLCGWPSGETLGFSATNVSGTSLGRSEAHQVSIQRRVALRDRRRHETARRRGP